MIFVETRGFTARLKEMLRDDAYRRLQNALLADPTMGDVMPGCGGLRKIRMGDARRGMGKRGGVRIIYLHIAEASRIDFLAVYGKNEKDDLTAQERRALAALAAQAKVAALAGVRKGGRRT